MKLYHGTTATVARKALGEGLLPRGASGTETNWRHTVESNPNTVYMTDVYAPYFAFSAIGEVDWGILEIDTDLLERKFLVPDEDWLEQATRGQKMPWWATKAKTMVGRTRWFREHAWKFNHLWEQSVKGLGTCGYLGMVPQEAITAAVAFDPTSNHAITQPASDPSITIINHKICAGKYEALTRWLMGESISVDDYLGWSAFHTPEEQKAKLAELLKDRSGWCLLRDPKKVAFHGRFCLTSTPTAFMI